MKLPNPIPAVLTKEERENAKVLFASPDFSANKALPAALKADCEVPVMAANNSNAVESVVKAKTTIDSPRRVPPAARDLFLPYRSAAMPNGILVTTAVIPITMITVPIRTSDRPCTFVRK